MNDPVTTISLLPIEYAGRPIVSDSSVVFIGSLILLLVTLYFLIKQYSQNSENFKEEFKEAMKEKSEDKKLFTQFKAATDANFVDHKRNINICSENIQKVNDWLTKTNSRIDELAKNTNQYLDTSHNEILSKVLNLNKEMLDRNQVITDQMKNIRQRQSVLKEKMITETKDIRVHMLYPESKKPTKKGDSVVTLPRGLSIDDELLCAKTHKYANTSEEAKKYMEAVK